MVSKGRPDILVGDLRNHGHVRHVYLQEIAFTCSSLELTDGMNEWRAFDVTDGTTFVAQVSSRTLFSIQPMHENYLAQRHRYLV